MKRFAGRRVALTTLSVMAGAAGCSFLVDSTGLEQGTSIAAQDGAPADVAAVDDASANGDGRSPSDALVPVDGPIEDGGGADAALADALVAEWRFDETGGAVAHDTTGHGHDARVVGAVLGGAGKFGNAVAFGSDTDAVVADDLAAAAFPRSGTLSLWIEPDVGAPDTTSRGALDDWDDSRDHFFLRRPPSATDFQVSFQRAEAGAAYPFSCTFYLPDATWKHVVITWDQANANGAVFVDAVEVKRYSYFGGAFAPSGQTLRLGGGFRGRIDQVQLYDRVLSSQEIAALQ